MVCVEEVRVKVEVGGESGGGRDQAPDVGTVHEEEVIVLDAEVHVKGGGHLTGKETGSVAEGG